MPWSVAFMVVMIVLVVTLGRVSREKYRAMARTGGDAALPADVIASVEEVRKLKQRVQVLERVITDGRGAHDLEGEIERLRDR